MPVSSDLAHPGQNGRTWGHAQRSKGSLWSFFCYDLKSQQRILNKFIEEYNYVRSHEALGMETPATMHQFSPREYPRGIPAYDYPSHMKVMNVHTKWYVRWKSNYWVSRAAEEQWSGIWKVFYRNVFLGYFNENDLKEKKTQKRLSAILV